MVYAFCQVVDIHTTRDEHATFSWLVIKNWKYLKVIKKT